MKAIQRGVPFYFGRQGRQLFGCFHEPTQESSRKCAVLICQPIGHEYINSHRALRQLATRMAEAGFPVLRFDYYGCGDSSGEAEQNSITQWLEDVSAAIDELRGRAGLLPVYVVGLRLGGTLAAICASQRNDVAGLVLWDPVLNGKKYFKQLLSLQQEMLRFRPHPWRWPNTIALLRARADLLRSLADRTLARLLRNLRLAVVRRHSGPSPLESVWTTALARLVQWVCGSSFIDACSPSLASSFTPGREPLPSRGESRACTEVLGFPVSNLLRDQLEALDLVMIPAKPSARVLLVHTEQSADEIGLTDHLGCTPAQVEQRKLEAPEIWRPTIDGSLLVPAQVLQSMVSWMCSVAS